MSPSPPAPARSRFLLDRLTLLLAHGFGSGRLPGSPGTFGSLVGMAWFLLLLIPGHPAVFLIGTVAAALLAIPLCTRAEQLLQRHDPGSVVLDEIIAVPVCFLMPLALATRATGHFPDASTVLHQWPGWLLPAVFLAFRVFDIAKPWPVHQVQQLPSGQGVVADDLLAALWVNVIALPLGLLPTSAWIG
jgi:phosphatidylglycerophosphatase A